MILADPRFLASLSLLLASTAAAQTTTVRDSLGQEYRLIDAVHFEMGAHRPDSFRGDHTDFNVGDDDQPIHPVILTNPFYMATTEVTVDQFRRFIEASEYRTTAERSDSGMVIWDPLDDPKHDRVKSSFRSDTESNWRKPGIPQQGTHPVIGISYHDAVAYCDWLSTTENATYRLPTEAEWECACRAGTATHFSFGDRYRQSIHQYANIGNVELERAAKGRVLLQWLIDVEKDPGDGHVFTSPVGSYQPNAWGLFDLHGNVWEWCEDRYLDTYYSQFKRDGHRQLRKRAIDPLCQERWNEHGDWRVIRGGSWFVAPIQCRSGVRGMFEAEDAACYVGFRVVRDASEDLRAQAKQRHLKSQAAMAALQSTARSVMEDRDGHIRFEFRCDDINGDVLRNLAELQYACEVHLGNPGRLTSEHLKQLAKIDRLTGLSISVGGDKISAKDFAPFAAHPEIQRLQITGTVDLSDQLIEYFRDARQLISINLQGDQITDAGLLQLPPLAGLQTLHVASTQSQGRVLERFAESPLREVSFANLDDDGAKLLAGFGTIRNLNLRNCPIGSQGLSSVAEIRLLESLQLQGCVNLADEDFSVLSRLANLVNLNLSETSAGDQAVAAICEGVSLRDLTIGSDSLTDAGLVLLGNLVSLQSLTLTDSATHIGDAGLADFWRLVNLQSLTINAPDVTGSGFAPLVELPRLRQLNIGSRLLNDVATQHIAAMQNLNELFIGGWNGGGPPGLTDAGLLKLAESSSLKKLTLLKGGTGISDQAVEKFKMLKPDVNFNVR